MFAIMVRVTYDTLLWYNLAGGINHRGGGGGGGGHKPVYFISPALKQRDYLLIRTECCAFM